MIRREDESKHRRKETGSSRGGDSRQVIIYDCNDVSDEDWEEHNHKEHKESDLKGKLGDFFLFVQSFYWPKTKTSFNRQFSPKRPKLVKKIRPKGPKFTK